MAVYKTERITKITPEFLKRHNISLLLLDLDNTLGSYSDIEPPEDIKRWAEKIYQSGISLFIVTNSKNENRTKNFAIALHASYRCECHKPLISKLNSIIYNSGYWDLRHRVALVGDQFFTDGLAGMRSNFLTILVRPIRFSNPWHAGRYLLEMPFRAVKSIEEMD